MFATAAEDGVLRVGRPGTRWLSTGFDGGECRADAACLVSVPEGFERTDLADYVDERLARADLACDGPALLTGLDLRHARGARRGPVTVVATAGVSNPAALPMDGEAEQSGAPAREDPEGAPSCDGPPPGQGDGPPPGHGTVNLVVGAERALADGALANLVAVAAEAKAATLLAEVGFPGTTSDAVVAACDPGGEPAEFTGSATAVGAAARVCVRDAVRASLRSRYADEAPPASVAAAEHGVVSEGRAEVFRPTDG